MPVSVSVNIFNSSRAISVQANTMPGNVVNLKFDWDQYGQLASSDLRSALSAVPYILAQKNTTLASPSGLNGTYVTTKTQLGSDSC